MKIMTINPKATSVFFFLTIVLFANYVKIYGQCDASFVEALKTKYKGIETNVFSEALYELSCNTKRKKSNTGLNIFNPEYGEVSYNKNGTSVTEACHKKDYSFFAYSSSDIAYSFLPEKSIDLLRNCFGGLTLGATKNGRQISIRAVGFPDPRTGDKIKVREFNISPKSALKCTNTFRKGEELIPGGRSIDCSLTKDKDITITLNTYSGDKVVYIKKEPKVKSVIYKWDIAIDERTKTYTCQNQFGKVGASESIRPRAERLSDATLLGNCIVRYGKGKVIVNGFEDEQKDIWSYMTAPGQNDPRNHICLINGESINNIVHNSPLDQTWGIPWAISSLCAGRYGVKF